MAADVNYIQVFEDTNSNCSYDGGTDTQIGSNLTPAGSPATATITIPASTISVIDTNQVCVHVLLATSSAAATDATVGIAISGSDDVVNSESYDWSATGGPPVSAGTSTITGSAIKIWNGGYGPAPGGTWTTANNWSPSGVPDSSTDCQIGAGGYSYAQFPNNTARDCLNVTLPSSGTLSWANRTTNFQVSGSLSIGSSYNFLNATNGTITMSGSTNQSISASTTFPGNFAVNSSGGEVTLESDFTVSGDFTLTAGTFRVVSGNTLTVAGDINVNGGTFIVDPNATVVLGNGSAFTVGVSGQLDLIGSSAYPATVTTANTSNAMTVVINGTLRAQYYQFSRLGAAGVTVNSGASIDATYHMQNGTFSYPVANGTTLLTLNRQVPGNAWDTMTFETGGSSATSPMAITTSTSAGTLTVTSYSGDLAADAYTTDPTYDVVWSTPTNTIDLTQEATSPGSVNQGETYNMGRFGFQQTQAGSFNDTTINYIRIGLTGTGSAADVSAVRLYDDTGCSGSGGTLIGTDTFSGNPARVEFSSLSVSVPAHATTPPLRCVYVEYDIDALATAGLTVGAQIVDATHVVNSEGYAFNASAAPPVTLGSAPSINGNTTTWTGSGGTGWTTAGSWTNGVPNSSLNCVINNTANDPIISGGTATCKSLNMGNGILTMTGGTLEVYGSFTNTGTFTQGGNTLVLRDDGATATNQDLQSSSSLTGVTFNKTAGGTVRVNSTIVVSSAISLGSGNNFTLEVESSAILRASAGITVDGATLQVDEGGTLQLGSGQTLTVSGGTLKTTGTNDAYPQSTTNKAVISNAGSGTWTFSATSGALDLVGFLIDDLDTNGLNIGGTTSVTQINGGQLRNLSTSYASVKGIQFNTTGSLPSTVSNFGWNWGPDNAPPATSESYLLASSTGCASQTVSFDQWFGDFFVDVDDPVTSTKVSATNCTINIAAAASPVQLTAFDAEGFDSVVRLAWSTGLEWSHQGFNVLRSDNPETGYVQINSQLIRNNVLSTTIHGEYVFDDHDVVNDQTYYYLIEDISTNNVRTLHGPVYAQPNAGAGSPPGVGVGVIYTSSNEADSSSGSDSDNSSESKEIAPYVDLLAATNSGMRLRITVPEYLKTINLLNPLYDDVNIAHYSLSTEAGKPALPERTILVKIPSVQAVTHSVVNSVSRLDANVKVAPAPEWVPVVNNLVPQWSIDSAAYADNQRLPQSNISLGNLYTENGTTYLPIKVQPIRFNPVANDVDFTSSITLDVFFNGASSWVPPVVAGVDPWAVSGAIKVGFSKTGIYEISYDELEVLGLTGPFANANVDEIQMYFMGQVLPIEIVSGDGVFNSGDVIRFFGPYRERVDSSENYVFLVNTPGVSGARVSTADGNPTSYPPISSPSHLATKRVEQDLYAYLNEPYGEDMDHILWHRFYAPPTNAGDEFFSVDVDLPNLIQTGDIQVSALLKGSRGGQIVSGKHHVRLWINNIATPYDFEFSTTEPVLATFKVESHYFVPGINRIQLEALGTYAGSQYDVIDIDYLKLDYPHAWVAENDVAEFSVYEPQSVVSLGHFADPNLFVYDISTLSDIRRIEGADVQYQVSTENTVSFNTDYGRKFFVASSAAVLEPSSLSMSNGSDLKLNTHQADILFIGTNELLSAAEKLVEHRKSQGFAVAKASVEDIANEFGMGYVNPKAIKDFIDHVYASWMSPSVKYVVILGDGTVDPKGRLGGSIKNIVPIKLVKGLYWDYASDFWYVKDDVTGYPRAAVGRIPATSAAEMQVYADKVIAFESGDRAPAADQSNRIVIVSDEDQYGGEHFDAKSDQLESTILSLRPEAAVTKIRKSQLSSAQAKTEILNSFSDGPLVMHYIGHGAEDMWSDSSVFTNADANNLSNTNTPIVVAMNCLNAHYYDPNRSYRGLGETLIFKKEGGAVAFWGSTSLTIPEVQTPIHKAFYETLVTGELRDMGSIINMAKVHGGGNQQSNEVVNSWLLIGDPALRLPSASFPAQVDPASPVVENAPQASGGKSGGCQVFAADGQSSRSGWPWLELLFLMIPVVINLTLRRLRKAIS
ncbi:MAG: hypothetical protein KDD59_00880 [Bdellovibrionales bacterium]|nr:hypothetical protein [Bdellovibrionales bacterium]